MARAAQGGRPGHTDNILHQPEQDTMEIQILTDAESIDKGWGDQKQRETWKWIQKKACWQVPVREDIPQSEIFD